MNDLVGCISSIPHPWLNQEFYGDLDDKDNHNSYFNLNILKGQFYNSLKTGLGWDQSRMCDSVERENPCYRHFHQWETPA